MGQREKKKIDGKGLEQHTAELYVSSYSGCEQIRSTGDDERGYAFQDTHPSNSSNNKDNNKDTTLRS